MTRSPSSTTGRLVVLAPRQPCASQKSAFVLSGTPNAQNIVIILQ